MAPNTRERHARAVASATAERAKASQALATRWAEYARAIKHAGFASPAEARAHAETAAADPGAASAGGDAAAAAAAAATAKDALADADRLEGALAQAEAVARTLEAVAPSPIKDPPQGDTSTQPRSPARPRRILWAGLEVDVEDPENTAQTGSELLEHLRAKNVSPMLSQLSPSQLQDEQTVKRFLQALTPEEKAAAQLRFEGDNRGVPEAQRSGAPTALDPAATARAAFDALQTAGGGDPAQAAKAAAAALDKAEHHLRTSIAPRPPKIFLFGGRSDEEARFARRHQHPSGASCSR